MSAVPARLQRKVSKQTQDYDRVEKLVDAFRKIFPRGFFRAESTDEAAKALAIAAKNLRDALVFQFEDPTKKKMYDAKVSKKVENFRKFLLELSTRQDVKGQAEYLSEWGGQKGPWDKVYEYANLVLEVIQILDTEVEDTLEVGPWHVTLWTDPRADWSAPAIKKVQWVLEEASKQLRSSGFSNLDGGRVSAYPSGRVPLSGGGSRGTVASYNPANDRINLSSEASAKELLLRFIHELGHRYYLKVMGSQGHKAWEAFFGDNSGPPAVDEIIRDWEKFVAGATSDYDARYRQYLAEYYPELKAKDPTAAMWLELTATAIKIDEPASLYGYKKDTVPGLDQLKARKSEAKVFLHPVTAYSGADPSELFAESFSHYIVSGPRRLPEVLRYTFEQAVPQIRTARRIARRYLRRCAGILEFPPKLKEQVWEWIRAEYAAQIMYNINHYILIKSQQWGARKKEYLDSYKKYLSEASRSLRELDWGNERIFKLASARFIGVKSVEELDDGKMLYNLGEGTREFSLNWDPKLVAFDVALGYIRDLVMKEFKRVSNLGEYFQDDAVVKLVELRTECLKYTDKAARPKKVKAQFPVDLTGWKYLSDNPEWQAGVAGLKTLTVAFFPKTHRARSGLWTPNTMGMEVDAPDDTLLSVPEFRKALDRIERTLEHEMRHLAQTVMRTLSDGFDDFSIGVPSKSIGTGPESEGLAKGLPRDQSDHSRPEHALRDDEFYTRLGDDVRTFLAETKRFPKFTWRWILKTWVGLIDAKSLPMDFPVEVEVHVSPFFKLLKKHQPDKWKKAVVEFTKAVSQKVDIPKGV